MSAFLMALALFLAASLPLGAAASRADASSGALDALTDLSGEAPSATAPLAASARAWGAREGHVLADWVAPDRAVVGFEGDAALLTPAIAAAAKPVGGEIVRVDTRLAFAIARVPADAMDAFLSTVRLVDGVRYAKQDMLVEAFYVPTDPLYPYQWGPAAMATEPAWNVALGTHNRTVAVIDTGVNASHPDLLGNLCVVGPDYVNGDADAHDDHGHGTHVAGTVAASIGNGVGVAGMANACLMSVKVLDQYGSGYFSDTASGIVWAADNGAHVVSMSLGGCPGCDPGSPVSDAVAYAEAEDVLVVAAAGNAYCSPVSYPAAYAEVVAVAALAAPGDSTASFSSCGPEVEVSAPGESVISTSLTSGPLSDPSGYMNLSGTSMATPHVSGAAALLWSTNLSLSAAQVRCVLSLTADDVMAPGLDEQTGNGRLNATRMLAQPQCIPVPPEAPFLRGRASDGGVELSWTKPRSVGSVISGYDVFRGDSPANLTYLAGTPGSAREFVDVNLTNGVTYHYAVRAKNGAGDGALSEPLALTPQPPRAVPYAVDFEAGADGWAGDALWHITSDRHNSSNTSWYFGIERGEGLDDNTYQTGETERGELVSPEIDLSNETVAVLRFWHHWEGEGGSWEHPIVEARTVGSDAWLPLTSIRAESGERDEVADLTPFVGHVVQLRFLWDTRDAVANDYEGWYVDDVRVLPEAYVVTCQDGADDFGNRCDVVDYSFVDIAANGTPVAFGDRGVSGAIALPFPFKFYGHVSEEIYVSGQGYVALSAPDTYSCCGHQPMPSTAAPNYLVAAYWSDFGLSNETGVRHATFGENGSRVLVVQYAGMSLCCDGASATFQVQFHEAGGTVEVHYLDVPVPGYGASAGIENCDGTDGIQFASGQARLQQVAVRYTPPTEAPTGCVPQPPNTPPTVVIETPSDGAVVSGTLTVSGTAWDPDANDSIVQLWAYVSNYTVNLDPVANWSFDVDTTSLQDGWHAVWVYAYDGVYSNGTGIGIEVANGGGGANTAPVANITSPAEGATVSGTIVVDGTAYDADDGDEVVSVAVTVDGGEPTLANGTASWSLPVDTAALSDGWHTLAASAYDGTAWGSSAVVTIYVDNAAENTPPVTTLASPQDGATLSGNVPLYAFANDSDPRDEVVWITFCIEPTDGGLGACSSASGPVYSGSVDTTYLADGAYVFSAYASDGEAYGNTATANVTVVNTVPNEPPTVVISNPAEGATVSGHVRVDGTAADVDGDVLFVQLRIDGGDWQDAGGSASWVSMWDTRFVPNGHHVIEARAFDGKDFSSPASVGVLVENGGAPTVVITWPTNGQGVGGVIAVQGVSTDPEGAAVATEVRIDGGEWRPAQTGESWVRYVDTRLLADGLHDIEARAFDGERHSPVALVQVFVYNAAPATLSIESPLGGAVVRGVVDVAGSAVAPGAAVSFVQVSLDGGPWFLAEGTTTWTRSIDTTQLWNGYHELVARAWIDGEWTYAWSWVYVENQADLAVTAEDIVVERQQIRTDAGETPKPLAETRTVRVTVRNEGTAHAPFVPIHVLVEGVSTPDTLASGSYDVLLYDWLEGLAPGESRVVEVEWDTTGWMGDAAIRVLLDSPGAIPELEESNNEASLRTYVGVGGLGGAYVRPAFV